MFSSLAFHLPFGQVSGVRSHGFFFLPALSILSVTFVARALSDSALLRSNVTAFALIVLEM